MKKEILIAVAGLTPQVITETLYYLTQIKKPQSKIDEIYVTTTADGKREIMNKLLDKSGKFLDFCREYKIGSSSIKFDEESIILLSDSKGRTLKDIRSVDDNKFVAHQIIDFIRSLTADPNVSLHCSVAGGRKTMSVYLAYALMLFGRSCDTLSHVLVEESLEMDKDFFFPKKSSIKKSMVELAEIPYLRLRDKIKQIIGFERFSLGEMMHSAQKELDKIPFISALEVNLKTRCLIIGDIKIRLKPKLLAIYAHFAERRRKLKNDLSFVPLKGKDSLFNNSNEVKDIITKILPNAEMGKYKFFRENLLQDISKINKQILEALGDLALASNYQILPEAQIRTYGATRYGLHIEKSKIKPLVESIKT